jgi:sporulation protein YlmC with PRC-barrel domain
MKLSKFAGLLPLITFAGAVLAVQQDTAPPLNPPNRPIPTDRTVTPQHSPASSSQAIRASQVIGSSVKSSDGQTAGQIRDIVVDPQSGRIEYAVLSLSGTAGSPATPSATSVPSTATPSSPSPTSYSASTGMKLVPVPWALFSPSLARTSSGTAGALGAGTMAITLNVDSAKLRSAPSFDGNNWSSLQSADFGQRTYSYYGLDWNNRTSDMGTPGAGVSRGAGTSSSDPSGTGTERKSGTGTTYPDRKGAGAPATSPQPK